MHVELSNSLDTKKQNIKQLKLLFPFLSHAFSVTKENVREEHNTQTPNIKDLKK